MKTAVFSMIAVLIGSFALLTYYGVTHSRGTPVPIEPATRAVLEVPFRDWELDLTSGVSPAEWAELPGANVELMYQVTMLPWAKGLVSPLAVKAFHNHKEIYFYMTWKDETQNRQIGSNQFCDAAAIMFPLEEEAEPSTIMMGFMGQANIWQWKACRDTVFWTGKAPYEQAYADFYYPFEDQETLPVLHEQPRSAVSDLVAIRVGTVTPRPSQDVQGRGVWGNGRWHVVFKRPLTSGDRELSARLGPGVDRLAAFAVWNGEHGDRGGRKSISEWVELQIQ